jgi:polyferredoxin
MSESPIHNPLTSTENLLVQAGHFLVLMSVGLSVTVLGARGACHYLCPFGTAVQLFRNRRLKARTAERLQ